RESVHHDEKRQQQQQREELIRYERLIRDEQSACEHAGNEEQQRFQASGTAHERTRGVVHDEPAHEIDKNRHEVPLRVEQRLKRELELPEVELRNERCEAEHEPRRDDERGTGIASGMLFSRGHMHQPGNAAPREPADRTDRCAQRVQREILEARYTYRNINLRDLDAEREQRTERGRREQRNAATQVHVEPQIEAEAKRQVQEYVRDSIAAPCPCPREFLERLEDPAFDRVRFEIERVERAVRDERDDCAEQPRDQRSRARHEKRGWRLRSGDWRANTSASIFWL